MTKLNARCRRLPPAFLLIPYIIADFVPVVWVQDLQVRFGVSVWALLPDVVEPGLVLAAGRAGVALPDYVVYSAVPPDHGARSSPAGDFEELRACWPDVDLLAPACVERQDDYLEPAGVGSPVG